MLDGGSGMIGGTVSGIQLWLLITCNRSSIEFAEHGISTDRVVVGGDEYLSEDLAGKRSSGSAGRGKFLSISSRSWSA